MILTDIADYLQTKSLGTVGTNIFIGFMPEAPDSVIVLQLGTSTPVWGTGDINFGVQVRVRGIDTPSVYNLAMDVYKALQGVAQQNSRKMYFVPENVPEILEVDEAGEIWVFNVSAYSD